MSRKKELLDLDDCIRRYQAGEPVQHLARELNIGVVTLYRRLHEAGVPNRMNYGQNHPRRRSFDVAAMVAAYEGGESLYSISQRTGEERQVVHHRFLQAGVKMRGISEAQSQRWVNIKSCPDAEAQTRAIVNAAHAAVRGVPLTEDAKVGLALGKFRKSTRHGMYEDSVAVALQSLGVSVLQQYPEGPYNLDIALDVDSIAVEIFKHRICGSVAKSRERYEHLFDAGWGVVFVIGRGHALDSVRIAENIVAIRQQLSGHEPARGQYWVIGRKSELAPSGGTDYKYIARILGA